MYTFSLLAILWHLLKPQKGFRSLGLDLSSSSEHWLILPLI